MNVFENSLVEIWVEASGLQRAAIVNCALMVALLGGATYGHPVFFCTVILCFVIEMSIREVGAK